MESRETIKPNVIDLTKPAQAIIDSMLTYKESKEALLKRLDQLLVDVICQHNQFTVFSFDKKIDKALKEASVSVKASEDAIGKFIHIFHCLDTQVPADSYVNALFIDALIKFAIFKPLDADSRVKEGSAGIRVMLREKLIEKYREKAGQFLEQAAKLAAENRAREAKEAKEAMHAAELAEVDKVAAKDKFAKIHQILARSARFDVATNENTKPLAEPKPFTGHKLCEHPEIMEAAEKLDEKLAHMMEKKQLAPVTLKKGSEENLTVAVPEQKAKKSLYATGMTTFKIKPAKSAAMLALQAEIGDKITASVAAGLERK